MSIFRGLEEKHEHAAQRVARDTRPLGIRVAEFLSKPQTMLVTCGMAAVGSMIFYVAADLIFVSCLCVFIFVYTRRHALPFRLPESSGVKDYNDLIPGTVKPRQAGGISYFGNDRTTGEELWFTNDDLRTHVLIFGSTGSGKTETLVSFAYNSLVHASGFIYVDGKGDNSLFAKVFSMCRSMGREDDMLLINFMTGARDVIGPQENRLSNTMNPFSSGSSSMISQLVISLMDSSSQNNSGDMWKGRAMNFVESLMKVLCAMRDEGHILLDANSIRDYFILEKLESIVVDKKFPIGDDHVIPLEQYAPQILEPLTAYVRNLPGYNPKNKGNQAGEVREQHGFITMQLTRVFGSLADTYGHIIRTNLAEVDLKDVVLNRRILVVLLPALEKSPEELSNLGKVIIASLKAMMAAGLGDAVEGDYRDVVLRKPTNSKAPYLCIMDEYGYYAVQGFAVVPAQARSLGFSAVFAGQDLPAFQKASKEEAASIGANCNIKICMKLEDPQETWEFFNKVAGETYVTNVSGFQMNTGSMAMNYMDTRNASVDRRQRIELLDLKDQRPGEAHIFFRSKIVRAEMFRANPDPAKKMRINHHLKVERPSDKELMNLEKRLQRFQDVLASRQINLPRIHPTEDLSILVDTLDEVEDLKPFERGIAALIAVLEHEVSRQRELSAPYEAAEEVEKMSAFTRIPVSPLVAQMIGPDNVDLFGLPLIRRGSTLEELKHIERLAGKTLNEAEKLATKLINDVEQLTEFPPEIRHEYDVATMQQDLNEVIQMLGGRPVDFDALGLSSKDQKGRALKGGELLDTVKRRGMPTFDELPELPDLDDLNNLLSEGKTDFDDEFWLDDDDDDDDQDDDDHDDGDGDQDDGDDSEDEDDDEEDRGDDDQNDSEDDDDEDDKDEEEDQDDDDDFWKDEDEDENSNDDDAWLDDDDDDDDEDEDLESNRGSLKGDESDEDETSNIDPLPELPDLEELDRLLSLEDESSEKDEENDDDDDEDSTKKR